jgi:hypothetical protein
MNQSVYCVFNVRSDGDGYNSFDLLEVCATIEAAKRIVNAELSCLSILPTKDDVAHHTMTEENNYTYIGYTDDCNGGFEGTNYNRGYVIQEMTLLK